LKGNRKIGEILLEAGELTPSALEAGLSEQRKRGTRLGEVLVHLKVASEEEVAKGLARQAGIPYIDLTDEPIEPPLLLLIPEPLVRKHLALPVRIEERRLVVAMAEPTNLDALSDLGFSCGMRISPVWASAGKLRRAIDRNYSKPGEAPKEPNAAGEPSPQVVHLSEDEEEGEADRGLLAPIIRLVNWILARAVASRASDIHIESAREEFRVRFRVDGLLREEVRLPKWIQRPLISRIKIMARLDIAERRHPQDGAVRLRIDERDLDLRVSILPTQFGEKGVLRILDTSRSLVGLDQVGLSKEDLAAIVGLLRRPSGMILVTGPTGSGKTTTLYGMIREIRSVTRNIVTVEDPIEYTMDEVNQTQVNAEIGLGFSDCLRAILRQDPNVILVGEIRDAETAEIACRAALTGHLVLSTLHTNDAPSALVRLVDLGVPRYLIASVVIAVLAQRLVRRLCSACARKEPGPIPVYRNVGCEKCDHEGFLGRIGLFELLSMTALLREGLMGGLPIGALRETAVSSGMVSLREDGLRKAGLGMTTREEVFRVAEAEESVEGRCERCGAFIEPDFLLCPGCGAAPSGRCASCGRSLRAGWRFCPYCRGGATKELS
jgi:type IV pilus assembly protein PilB